MFLQERERERVTRKQRKESDINGICELEEDRVRWEGLRKEGKDERERVFNASVQHIYTF